VQEFKDLAAARAGTGLKAVFEPLIDQYSFVTDRDTGGTLRRRYDPHTASMSTRRRGRKSTP